MGGAASILDPSTLGYGPTRCHCASVLPYRTSIRSSHASIGHLFWPHPLQTPQLRKEKSSICPLPLIYPETNLDTSWPYPTRLTYLTVITSHSRTPLFPQTWIPNNIVLFRVLILLTISISLHSISILLPCISPRWQWRCKWIIES